MRIIKPIAILLALALSLAAAQRLLTPKYMTEIYDGALIAEYYQEPKNHQILFVGDCEVYENFSPVALWRSEGYTSYIRGGAQQLIWQSYYLLEDSFRYETPDIAVFNVLSMKYDAPQSEAYNRLNIDGMALSASKLGAARASMTEGESLLSYIFPLLRYHDRWSQLTGADFQSFFQTERVGHNGFLMRSETVPVGWIPDAPLLADYSLGELCWEYLEKMRLLCEEKGVTLVLIKAPSLSPPWYQQWDEQIIEYAETHGLWYINFLEQTEAIGLDWDTDSYDAGLHLNISGAEKLAVYFGALLRERYALPDLRSDSRVASLWEEKAALYDEHHQRQLQELEQTGKVASFTY